MDEGEEVGERPERLGEKIRAAAVRGKAMVDEALADGKLDLDDVTVLNE